MLHSMCFGNCLTRDARRASFSPMVFREFQYMDMPFHYISVLTQSLPGYTFLFRQSRASISLSPAFRSREALAHSVVLRYITVFQSVSKGKPPPAGSHGLADTLRHRSVSAGFRLEICWTAGAVGACCCPHCIPQPIAMSGFCGIVRVLATNRLFMPNTLLLVAPSHAIPCLAIPCNAT